MDEPGPKGALGKTEDPAEGLLGDGVLPRELEPGSDEEGAESTTGGGAKLLKEAGRDLEKRALAGELLGDAVVGISRRTATPRGKDEAALAWVEEPRRDATQPRRGDALRRCRLGEIDANPVALEAVDESEADEGEEGAWLRGRFVR